MYTCGAGLSVNFQRFGVPAEGGFGTGADADDANVSMAIYNLFGMLTTVNHPDIFMWQVNQMPWTILIMMSFMFFTMIIGLNLLLAIIYGEYTSILTGQNESNAKLRAAMIDTAFDLLVSENDDHLSPEQLYHILCMADQKHSQHALEDADTDHIEMVVRLVDNKANRRSEFNLAKSQDHRIDRQDMHELLIFFAAPIKLKSVNKPADRCRTSVLLCHGACRRRPVGR